MRGEETPLLLPSIKAGGSLRPPPPKLGKVWRASPLEGRATQVCVPAATAPVHRRHQCLELVGVNDELGHDSTESY